MYKKILVSFVLLVLASCGAYDQGAEASSDPETRVTSTKLTAVHIAHGADVVASDEIDDTFTVNVPYAFDTVTFMFKTEDSSASIIFEGETLNPGDSSSEVDLNAGDNDFDVIVSSGGEAKTYKMIVHRGTDNANLLSFTNAQGTLSPSFDSSLISYSLNTVDDNLSITLSVEDGATVLNTLTSDVASTVSNTDETFTLDLSTDGHYILTIKVSSSDGTSTKTYTFNIAKLKNTGLTDIDIQESYSLNPSFDSDRAVYTVFVPYTASTVHFSADKADSSANLDISGTIESYTNVDSGAYKTFSLNKGTNEISFEVSKGTENSTYKVYVVRGDSEARLKALELDNGTMNPSFDSDIYSYVIREDYTESVVSFTPTTIGVGATVADADGSEVSSGGVLDESIDVGVNNITLTVTSSDGTTTKEYHFTIIRGSDDASLSSLKINAGGNTLTLSPSFNSDTIVYSAETTEDTVTVTATASDSNASISLNGNSIDSGVESHNITLSTGSNTLSISVSSSDGLNDRTYTVYINKE